MQRGWIIFHGFAYNSAMRPLFPEFAIPGRGKPRNGIFQRGKPVVGLFFAFVLCDVRFLRDTFGRRYCVVEVLVPVLFRRSNSI